MSITISTPDLGVGKAEIIELLVTPGEQIEAEQGVVMVESDKASMEIPSPQAGIIEKLLVKVGDSVSQGQDLALLRGTTTAATTPTPAAVVTDVPPQAATDGEQHIEILVPDLGVDSATVIEILAKPGDSIEHEQGLVMVESDKANMEIPSPHAGSLVSLAVKEGDKITNNQLLGVVVTSNAAATAQDEEPTPVVSQPAPQASHSSPPQPTQAQPTAAQQAQAATSTLEETPIYAGPAVRKLARHLGIDLRQITATGANGRMRKEDLYGYVQNALGSSNLPADAPGYSSAPAGDVDFSKFGTVAIEPMTRLHQLTADNMTKTSLVVPQVTQFDQADITDLEAFRKSIQDDASRHRVRLTLVAFVVMAAARALGAMPQVNVSINKHQIVRKSYCNIGLAVDTPAGLMVPVIRDADAKGLYQLAEEIGDLAARARSKALKPDEMKGGCFTVSSLGAVGGTGFTPLVNHPEVAILGVCKSTMQPVWNGEEFIPRLLCPLALSYDHRAINGADGARFLRLLADWLADPRKMLL